MSSERWTRIVTAVGARGPSGVTASGLCATSAELMVTSGAGITLLGSGTDRGPMCSSDETTRELEELQFTLGQGPCADVFDTGRPVLEPDLVGRPATRWTVFAGPAMDAGVVSVFSFPLQVGAARLGALTFYQDRARALTSDDHADAVVLSEVVTRTILALQAELSADAFLAGLAEEGSYHAVVHQASGMVSAQLEVSVAEALVRLRAHAFAVGTTVSDVAEDVVARRLKLTT